MRIGEKIKLAREARGLSQEALAKAVGISQPAIKKIESGETERSRFLPELVAFLGIESSINRPQLPPDAFPVIPADVPIPIRSEMPFDVPVLGTAEGGNGDSRFQIVGEVVDYVRRPPGIAKAKNVFCLYVRNGSMYPVYRDGDLLYLNPSLPTRVGDDVVVEFIPSAESEYGEGIIKRLVRKTSTKIIVEQFNPPKELEYELDTVKAIHRVLTLSELMGV